MLSENQKNILDAITPEINTPQAISEQTGKSLASVNTTLTSLEKKELIRKNKDGTIQSLVTNHETTNHESPVPIPQSPIPVLIPYLKSEAAGDELKYALRSFDKNLDAQFKVIVIGDREDWFNDEHITHIPTGLYSDDPQVDVANKLLTAIASLDLQGKFIFTYDDVFLLGKTDLAELLPYAFGKLENAGTKGTQYHDAALRTASQLQKMDLDTIRYDAHTPVVFDAFLISEIISDHKATEAAVLVKSLYFNKHKLDHRPIQVNGGLHDPILASVYKSNPQLDTLHTAIQTRKFLNCNTAGWKAVEPFLKSLFPNKSKFEI